MKFDKVEQLTKEQAIALHDSKAWEAWTPDEIVKFQLFQSFLAVPFDKFHEALEAVLGRPVFTHELELNYDGIVAEYLKEKPAPTFEEVINLIPEEKRIIIGI